MQIQLNPITGKTDETHSPNSKSHSNATFVGFVEGSSMYNQRTPPSPSPCRLGIILNATWNKSIAEAYFRERGWWSRVTARFFWLAMNVKI
jgi:hypothetical protein